ncbi:MAG: glycoside hydrolase family 3 C-terminal domain-containing protein [Hyphomonas sp.]|uniref:beta-glucosidase n=1 Tax=Hyphomonas sp. TaxID=87 RepID=UPI00326627B4
MGWKLSLVLTVSMAVISACATTHAQSVPDPAEVRAAETESQMTNEKRIQLTLGLMAMEFGGHKKPEGSIPGAGYVPGVPRLGVPPLRETDASLGVTWIGGARSDGATALPSGTAQGATWNEELIEQGGAMIGSEARLKGFNVMLAGGINLMREPRNGRTFEYIGEDPYHSAVLGAAAVRGIQSQGVISTMKHFAINPQETGRHFMNVKIDEPSLRESDLLAFEIAIERARPGALMCAYNRTNGPLSCGSEFLLTDVLRDDWGYKGFVMSDWGAVEAVEFALAGLDQQSGAQLDEGLFLGEPLLKAADKDARYQKRLHEMAQNVLYAIYDVGVSQTLPEKTSEEAPDGMQLALQVAQEGIVLLKNKERALPLSKEVGSVAIIGGHADVGVLSGGGSSRSMPDEGPTVIVPVLRGKNASYASMTDEMYHGLAPKTAIQTMVPDARVTYRDGRYLSEAVQIASTSDVAIIVVTQFLSEGFDAPDISLPGNQDALISAVASANPNTIVVLQTGGPVAMPWLDDVAAVVEAWYPGIMGGEAIADVLFGEVNPSGHLPITFPVSLSQLPRPQLDGADTVEPSFLGSGNPNQTLDVDYSIEGSDVGYRWFARQGARALFPFGHGLSYTSFGLHDLALSQQEGEIRASFSITNTGDRVGADVGQVYLVSGPDGAKQRLVGFGKLTLDPGATGKVDVGVDPRLLAEWENDGWAVAAGEYRFALGANAVALGQPVALNVDRIRLDASGKP